MLIYILKIAETSKPLQVSGHINSISPLWDRSQLNHTEQEIDIIIHMGVFSGDKTGFVRLGHICFVTTL